MSKTDFTNRVIELIRKSDSKVFPAEVRIVPSRFVDDMSSESITVAYIDAENSFSHETTVLTYNEDWGWTNDTWMCRYILPEPVVEVQEQTPRSISPIATKQHNMTVSQ